MDLLNEIRECFASTTLGARRLMSLPTDYSAFVIRTHAGYGVAIKYKDSNVILENFANCKLYNRELNIDGETHLFLILECSLEGLRYEFATICAQFVDPGINGIERKKIITNPLNWWKNWKKLIGNSIVNKTAYQIIAEMLVLDYLYSNNSNINWTAIESGVHDIESSEESYEVKSTIKRYGSTVTISGQFQLNSNTKVYLYFIRLENSSLGISINDIRNSLVQKGYNAELIEEQLKKLGYEYGLSIRDEKYKVLEKRRYLIDQNFPKITKESFKNNKIPDSIIHITYTVDLDGLEYTNW